MLQSDGKKRQPENCGQPMQDTCLKCSDSIIWWKREEAAFRDTEGNEFILNPRPFWRHGLPRFIACYHCRAIHFEAERRKKWMESL